MLPDARSQRTSVDGFGDVAVAARGGGIGERPANLALMRERGWVVSLSITAETAWQRLRAEAQAFGLCFSTSDMREGANAFLERRKPAFNGS